MLTKLKPGYVYCSETFPSGGLTLDFALGGGLPKGIIVEIYGSESSGKTTLALHACHCRSSDLSIIAKTLLCLSCKTMQKLGGNALLVDAEDAFDSAYSKALGVDVENLIVCQPDNGEMALEKAKILVIELLDGSTSTLVLLITSYRIPSFCLIADRMCRSGAIDLICINSVSALTPRAEIEIGVYYGNREVKSGGIALKFFASLRLEIRSIGKMKSGDEDIGVQVRVRVQKSKVSRPYKQTEFEIIFGQGVSIEKGSLKLHVWHKHQAFKWLGQGRDRALQFLRENPYLSDEIEKVGSSNPGTSPLSVPHQDEEFCDDVQSQGVHRRRGPWTENKIEDVEANVVIRRSMHWLIRLGLSADFSHFL
ncbi:DNA repair protein recA homolog 1, chloroplastic-like protein [Drosera capensis]